MITLGLWNPRMETQGRSGKKQEVMYKRGIVNNCEGMCESCQGSDEEL
jgi:hypothetical protein